MIRPFTVTPVLNGYLVSIGCQNLAFTSKAMLTDTIKAYLDDPEAVEKDFIESGINSKHLIPRRISVRSEERTQDAGEVGCSDVCESPLANPVPAGLHGGGTVIGVGPAQYAERY